jgi:hypothetical protein
MPGWRMVCGKRAVFCLLFVRLGSIEILLLQAVADVSPSFYHPFIADRTQVVDRLLMSPPIPPPAPVTLKADVPRSISSSARLTLGMDFTADALVDVAIADLG